MQTSNGLNALQQRVFEVAVKRRKNVFITGPGGVGKSFTIKEIIKAFDDTKIRSAVTASTGAAAILIGGITIHRWSGCDVFAGTGATLAKKILETSYKQPAKNRWLQTDVLVIDEISMIDGADFDKLEEVARIVRKNPLPFGGLQVILCGDFAQLPPVKPTGGFCFQAKCWSKVILPENQIELTEIVRQSDASFKRALNEIRLGHVSSDSVALLRSRVGAQVGTDLIKPTMLYSRRIDVQTTNITELNKIAGEPVTIKTIDTFVPYSPPDKDKYLETLNRDLQAPPSLQLKIGAQVMLIFNHSDLLVNGSRGVVVGFEKGALPIVRFLTGETMIIERHKWKVRIGEKLFFERFQVPLILAWALTTHKSQGATLDCAEIDIAGCFEYGQAYVALSRVRNLDGLSLKGNDLSKITAHPIVKKYYQDLANPLQHSTPTAKKTVINVGALRPKPPIIPIKKRERPALDSEEEKKNASTIVTPIPPDNNDESEKKRTLSRQQRSVGATKCKYCKQYMGYDPCDKCLDEISHSKRCVAENVECRYCKHCKGYDPCDECFKERNT